MPVKKLLLMVILFITVNVSGQNNFTYSPEKPKAGEAITISYAPAGNLANTTAKLEGVVYRLGDKGQMTDELDLKKAGDKYIAVVKTDTTDNFIFFSFSADKKFDNNFNSGYWIPLYDGDKIKKRANANTAAFYQFYGRDAGVEPNNDKALQYMDEEFKLYPEFKKNDLVQYVRLYSRVKKEEAPAFIQKEIEEEIKSGLK
ncbi:MAG: hypothetical protein M3Z56_04845, partial [Bacteroidota bacterium]|nr:hypothetical protein [Bacteroidota bacterium]